LNSKYIYIPPYVPWQYDLAPTIHNEQPAVPGAIAGATWTIDGDTRDVLYASPTSTFNVFHGHLPQNPLYLKTAIAMQPESWDKEGDGVQFEIYLQREGRGSRELLFSRYMDPKHNPSERHWIPVGIDVSRYVGDPTSDFVQPVGAKVSFIFVTKPGPSDDSLYDWAGWVEPVLVVPALDTGELELLYDGPNKVYLNRDALPRAWVVHRVTQVPENDIEAVETRLVADDFDPAVEAIVEGALPGSLGEVSDDDQVKITSYTAHRIEIEADLNRPGVLVLSDMFYPGWRAYIDGIEQVIYPTNLTMRGVYLEAGKHQVIFEYRPSLFITGLCISSGSIVLVLVALTVQQLRKRHY
jgi:hypothetical protein